jgi:hypothetical protein
MSQYLLATIVGCGILATNFPVAARDRDPPPIRAFDLATIEKLGRDIYSQDQLAWKATDILMMHRTERVLSKEGMNGWIVSTTGNSEIVRFIKRGRRGPELLYDISFASGAGPEFSVPRDKALNADEVAQYNARELALKNVDSPCSDRYNTVVLKDPEGDGWIAWALAATTNPDLILVGGNYRITVSANGKRVRQKDRLSRSCIRFDKKEMDAELASKSGAPSHNFFVSNVVSLTPTESHVFTALNYQITLRVGTNDGKTWKIDDGQVTAIDQDSPDLDGFTARSFAGQQEQCGSILSKLNEEPPRFYNSKGLDSKVILQTEGDEPFSLSAPEGFKVVSALCVRNDIVPALNDYKVLLAGYNLYIIDKGVGHPDATGKLELINGAANFTLIDGESSSPEIEARVNARLKWFNEAISKSL